MRVKSKNRMRSRSFIEQLTSSGRYHFTSHEARMALEISAEATKLALNRLRRQDLIASPARGFYVIVPPEYRSLGCLPADQFIPALIEQKKDWHYYAGLLSAAQYYGAAHHRPQQFQVILEKNRRPIRCGKVRVMFIARKLIAKVPTRSFNTPRGEIQVSSPEATAIDLAGYPQHAGGLDQVATILAELAAEIDPSLLPQAAETAPLPWAQRLGYLLERVEAGHLTESLKAYVNEHAREYTPLMLGAPIEESPRERGWKIILNSEVESEL